VVLSEMGANVVTCTLSAHRDVVVEMRFLFQVSEIKAIENIIAKIKSVDGVFEARRMMAGDSAKKKETS
jgi:GTP pyrophosphokinase